MSEMQDLPPWPWPEKVRGTIIKRREDAAVGLFVLLHTDRRVYRRDETGRARGGPIGRYAYEPAEIVGENKVSWIIGFARANYPKVPSARRPARFYGLEDVEDILWRGAHAYRLGDHVKGIRDIGLLQRIASMTGYQSDLV